VHYKCFNSSSPVFLVRLVLCVLCNTRGIFTGHCIIRLMLISNPQWLINRQFSARHDAFPVVGCRRVSSSCVSGNDAIAQLGTARYATGNCWCCYAHLHQQLPLVLLPHWCSSTCTNWHKLAPTAVHHV